MKQLIQIARQLGIHIEINTFHGNGYHWYDQINNIIMLDDTAEEITIEDIVHEYVHSLQWQEGYRDIIIKELDNNDVMSHEYHAELVCTHYEDYIDNNGKLNKKDILSYYDDIVAYLYE